jgi:hypothetical protein
VGEFYPKKNRPSPTTSEDSSDQKETLKRSSIFQLHTTRLIKGIYLISMTLPRSAARSLRCEEKSVRKEEIKEDKER